MYLSPLNCENYSYRMSDKVRTDEKCIKEEFVCSEIEVFCKYNFWSRKVSYNVIYQISDGRDREMTQNRVND